MTALSNVRAVRMDLSDQIKATGTTHRVVRLLSAIADTEGAIRVGSLARRLDLAPSTTHRLLNLLKVEGLVESAAESHEYAIGTELYRMAARVMERVQIAQVAQGTLQRLTARFHETVLLGSYIPNVPAMTFVARADGPHPLQYRIQMNQHLSLIRGASGKSILAHLPDEVVTRALQREQQSYGPTPSFKELQPLLRSVQRRGFAASEGEKLPGAQGIAAPVFRANGIFGCLCLTAPKGRIARDQVGAIGEELMAAASALSRALGASTLPPTYRVAAQ